MGMASGLGAARLLVLDGDAAYAAGVCQYLAAHGYEVRHAGDGLTGLRLCYTWQPHLVILDVVLPKLDGWAVCARLRELSDVPIVILTACGQEADRVRGLQGGADDYLVKPCSDRELVARVAAILRRAWATLPPLSSPQSQDQALRLDGDVVIDLAARQVLKGGQVVRLTRTEWRLLFVLADNAGRIVPHERLLERVWGAEYVGNTEYLKLYIWRLRRKIERNPKSPQYILTEHGIGHRLAVPAARLARPA